jgi:hypothetical protein
MLQIIRNSLPYPVKSVLRFFRYSNERSRYYRELSIKREQDQNIKRFSTQIDSLIIFFVPGADIETGKETISVRLFPSAKKHRKWKMYITQKRCFALSPDNV